jgi:hypothetical protein
VEDKRTQDLAKMARLKQRQETWLYTIRRAPAWVTPKGERPYRPFLFMVLDARTGSVLVSDMRRDAPAPDSALESLAQAMLRPAWGAGGRRRPSELRLDREDIALTLTPLLAQIGVRCSYQATLPLIDETVRSMAVYLNKEEPLPGLLSVPGITVPLVAEFYETTAEYYRRAIWRWVDDSQPIEVRYSREENARYAVILGHGGEAFGLALYDSLADLALLYSSNYPEGMAKQLPAVAIVFDEQRAMAFDDLDSIEAHGWPIAGENAYPTVNKVVPGEAGISALTMVDLLCAIAVLQVLPDYVCTHLPADSRAPGEAKVTYPLSGVHHGQEITLRYPALLEGPERSAEASSRDLQDVALEAYISGWHFDNRSYALAREVGAFLMAFLDHQVEKDLSDRTLAPHAQNCWAIGKLVCRQRKYRHLSPDMWGGEPRFVAEFRRETNPSATALASYQRTWRKLSRYAESLDEDAWEGFLSWGSGPPSAINGS